MPSISTFYLYLDLLNFFSCSFSLPSSIPCLIFSALFCVGSLPSLSILLPSRLVSDLLLFTSLSIPYLIILPLSLTFYVFSTSLSLSSLYSSIDLSLHSPFGSVSIRSLSHLFLITLPPLISLPLSLSFTRVVLFVLSQSCASCSSNHSLLFPPLPPLITLPLQSPLSLPALLCPHLQGRPLASCTLCCFGVMCIGARATHPRKKSDRSVSSAARLLASCN